MNKNSCGLKFVNMYELNSILSSCKDAHSIEIEVCRIREESDQE
jgi:hypothetical protein